MFLCIFSKGRMSAGAGVLQSWGGWPGILFANGGLVSMGGMFRLTTERKCRLNLTRRVHLMQRKRRTQLGGWLT